MDCVKREFSFAGLCVYAIALSACTGNRAHSDGGFDVVSDQRDVVRARDARPALHRDGGDINPPEVSDVPGPALLSGTGLYAQIGSRTIASGIIEYLPRYELWSDGLQKRRFFSLPANTQINTSNANHWVFPVGTRAWKEFSVDGRLIETRLLLKVRDTRDGWFEMAYQWRADGSDADAVADGVDDASQTTHRIPSQSECAQCHAGVRDTLIGLSALQLNTPMPPSIGADGGASDASVANDVQASDAQADTGPPREVTQLEQFAMRNWLSVIPTAVPTVPGSGTEQQALAYMHANCGHCHSDQGWFASEVALRLALDQRFATPAETPAYRTAIGAQMFHTVDGTTIGVVPGLPERSQLWVRMGLRDLEAMPPVCTQRVDPDGLAVIRGWITGLR